MTLFGRTSRYKKKQCSQISKNHTISKFLILMQFQFLFINTFLVGALCQVLPATAPRRASVRAINPAKNSIASSIGNAFEIKADAQKSSIGSNIGMAIEEASGIKVDGPKSSIGRTGAGSTVGSIGSNIGKAIERECKMFGC